MEPSLSSWALPRIKRLLDLDDKSLTELLDYTLSLSKEEGAEHLKNLLGDSPAALEFITGFSSRRPDPVHSKSSPVPLSDEVPRSRKSTTKKSKPPLHNAGPVRRPDGYGHVHGGYQKRIAPDALQVPRFTQGGSSSRDVSPVPVKLPPSASGNLISDFMPNVRSKTTKKPVGQPHPASPPARNGPSITTSNLTDLTSAIAALELVTNPKLSSERRHCDCNATIHPLFATAPNCLNCGKIICALEGLQPCSFCDAPILAKEHVDAMIRTLKEERGVEKMAQHNAGVAQTRSGASTPRMGAGTPGSAPDSGDEAARAKAHRDKLLSFQRENAQRTKIHDEAADFDATLTPGATQWMSPVQRAVALKKQQQYLRELEEANRPEWEKKKTVMSIGFKNGKLVKTYGKENAPPVSSPDHDIGEGTQDSMIDQYNLSANKSGAFSNNPLMKGGGLIRPVWKSDTEKSEGKAAAGDRDNLPTERKSVWRRVQDDDEDNEEWILDGGLRGHGTDSRLVNDGSQQECG